MADFVEIDIDQGIDFALDFGFKNDDGTPKNLTGYTFASSIKKSYYSLNPVATFSVNYTNASTGEIVLELSSTQTKDIKPGRYLFDIKQVDNYDKVDRVVEGIVTVNPLITE